MNRRQRITIFIGSLIIVAMLLFPPMSGYWGKGRYHFFFSPRGRYIPELDQYAKTGRPTLNGWVSWQIDQERLIFQVLIAAVLTGGISALLGSKRE